MTGLCAWGLSIGLGTILGSGLLSFPEPFKALHTMTTVREKEPHTRQKRYTYEQAVEASTQYFNGDELAAGIWVNKYALKDSFGNLYERTPDDMHRRLAAEIARIESRYPEALSEEEVYSLLKGFRYLLPQGGPMAGIGNPFQVASLSNCFVIGNTADSYAGIFRLDEELVQLMKRRGGVGLDLSHIRPKGSPVKNSALTSTGIVPFMERFSNSTREVAQDGRRGALMLTVSIKHPDAEDFIDAKLDLKKITGANISVRIDDAFVKAARAGKMYKQQFPIDSKKPVVTKKIDAAKLWKKLVYNSWKSAEPGILFWDTIIRESVPDCYADLGFQTVSTNPCGEIPLTPYDSCRLLAINLYSYVKDPFTPKARFDFDLFEQHARLAVRVMDSIVDLELEQIDKILHKLDQDPEPDVIKRNERELWEKIREKAVKGRRTGIGITAEGDMLAALGLRYGTPKATRFSTKVHKALALHTYRESVRLAQLRGPFPIFDAGREKDNPFIKRLKKADPDLYSDMVKYGRRNIALLTIAPTGSVSILSQTTSGLEPVFMVSYKRRRKINANDPLAKVDFIDQNGDKWEEYHVFHHKFVDWLKINGYDLDKVSAWSSDQLNKLIAQSPYYKATANDVDWLEKVRLQGSVQKWVDHSISVTVNVPRETTVQLVDEIFYTAWKAGCKGITIYRDGSRSGVLVSEESKAEQNGKFKVNESPKRPVRLPAEVVRFRNNNEQWIAVVGLMDGKPYEIFTGRSEDTFIIPKKFRQAWVLKSKDENGENRYDFQIVDKDGYRTTFEGLSRSFDKEYWNYAKLISGVLRYGMPLPKVIDLVKDLNVEDGHLNTWKNGVVRALKKFVPNGTKDTGAVCENCGEKGHIVYLEGCQVCQYCGDSKCG